MVEEGIGRVRDNWDGNWEIDVTWKLSKFKVHSLVSPLPLVRDGTSLPNYGHYLGAWSLVLER